MTDWSQYLRDVLPYVPGCPEPVAEQSILRAAREFCTKARPWVVDLAGITILDGVTAYPLVFPAQAELVRLESAKAGSIDVAVTREQFAKCRLAAYTLDGKTLTVKPGLTAGTVLVVNASLKPSNAATQSTDGLFDEFVEAIAAGAIAKLSSQPGKPYSNPGVAAQFAGEFDKAVGVTLTRLWRGRTAASPRTVANFF